MISKLKLNGSECKTFIVLKKLQIKKIFSVSLHKHFLILKTTFLSLGSNCNEAILIIEKSIDLLNNEIGVLVNKSAVYFSSAWGFNSENKFFNQVVVFETALEAEKLLEKIKNIETELGKTETSQFFNDRNIDIDILFYNNEVFVTENLCIPHPLLHFRLFCLQPLCEINPNLLHPVLNKTVNELLTNYLIITNENPLSIFKK